MIVTFVHSVTGQTREIAVADGTEASKVLTKARNNLAMELAHERGGDNGSQWHVLANHRVKRVMAVWSHPKKETR
jgi:hypothetical protein